MGSFQVYFEMIGAVAFAVSGAALGIRKGMDLFGVAMMGMTTAVGGGILRDMMLGQTPPAALRDPAQALVAIAVSLLVFYIWRRRKTDTHNKYAEAVLLVADSIGLGIFSAHGAAIARRGTAPTGFWCCFWALLPVWAAACCGTCAAWRGPTSSPSTYTPARLWPVRRYAVSCGRWGRGWPCWPAAA